MQQQRDAEAPLSILATGSDIAFSRRTTSEASGRLRMVQGGAGVSKARVQDGEKRAFEFSHTHTCCLCQPDQLRRQGQQEAVSRLDADMMRKDGGMKRGATGTTPVGVVGPALHDEGAQLWGPPGGYGPPVAVRHLQCRSLNVTAKLQDPQVCCG